MFNLTKRDAEIGVFNNRVEMHGDEEVPAIDLPVTVGLNLDEMRALVPSSEDATIVDVIFNENGEVVIPVVNPMTIHRKPEDLQVTLYDSPTTPKNTLVFNEVKVKSMKLEFRSGFVGQLSMKLQLVCKPKDLPRIVACQKHTRSIEVKDVSQEQLDAFNSRATDQAQNNLSEEEA